MGPELAPFAKLQPFPGTGDILVPEARQMETNFLFSRDSEAAFGSESATRGGSTRTRWGKGVAAPGCARKTGENHLCSQVFGYLCSRLKTSRSGVWHRKCDHGRLVLDQN